MPAGKENVDTCLRKIAKDHSEVLTVDAVLAALVVCQNRNAFEEKKTSLQVRYLHLWLTALTYGPHKKKYNLTRLIFTALLTIYSTLTIAADLAVK